MRGRTFWIGTALLAWITVLYFDHCTIRTKAVAGRSQVPDRGSSEPRPAVVSWQPPAPPPVVVVQNRPAVERATPIATAGARSGKPETMLEQFAPVHDALERAFDAESHDAAWAMSAQRLAETAMLAMLPPRSAISSVVCRATLCRIESTHAGETYVKAFVNELGDPAHRPWNGAFYAGPVSQEARSGVVTVVTYLAREGATMPAIPDASATTQRAEHSNANVVDGAVRSAALRGPR
jgi:hypothetical protein